MDPQIYTPLSQDSDVFEIRLLRLLPSLDSNAPIHCSLITYRLHQDEKPNLYEALSYVWGDPDITKKIIVANCSVNVTVNLHAALQQIRDRYLERFLWVDALCINQRDPDEIAVQILSMGRIYGQASCVLVWLGEEADDSDTALEDTRVYGSEQRRESLTIRESLGTEAIKRLLMRPWFSRIWVLQEIASARRIQILCGSTVLDGFSFSAGVQRLRTYPPAVHLITRAASRPPVFGRDHIRATTDIYELGHLLDMYHTYKATKQHDKVYALLGICANLNGDLQPNYTLLWHDLFHQTISHIFGTTVQIRTWPQREIAMISGRAFVCGLITSVESEGIYDQVTITGPTLSSHTSAMSKFSRPIQIGDLICILNGNTQATVIRPCEDFFQIIATQIPMHDALNTSRMNWPKYLQIQHDLCLLWDWELSTQALGSNVQHQKLGDRLGEELLQPGDEGICEKSTRMLKIAELLVELRGTSCLEFIQLENNARYTEGTCTRLQTLLDHHIESLQLEPADQLNLMWKLLIFYPKASLIDKVPNLTSQACDLQVPSREGDVWRALRDLVLPSSPPQTWIPLKLVGELWHDLQTFIMCLEIQDSYLSRFLISRIKDLKSATMFLAFRGAHHTRNEAIFSFSLHHRKEELGYTTTFFLLAYLDESRRGLDTAQIRQLCTGPSRDYARTLVRILDLTEAVKTPAALVLRYLFMKNRTIPDMAGIQPTELFGSLIRRAEVDGLLANRTCITATVDIDQALADLLDTFYLPIVTLTSGMLLIAAEMCNMSTMHSLLWMAAVSRVNVTQEIAGCH